MQGEIFALSAVILFVIFLIEIVILALKKPIYRDENEYHSRRDLKNIKNYIEEDSD